MRGRPRAFGLGLVAVAATALSAQAVELRVVVTGLRSDSGSLLVAVCREADFLGRECAYTARAPARAGEVTVAGFPAGAYAVQAIHDENDNGDLDLGRARLPLEGLGFSRDAPMRFGPPRFDDAAFEIGEPGATLSLRMRYFQ